MNELAQLLTIGLVLATIVLSITLGICIGERNRLALENAYFRAKLGLKPDDEISEAQILTRPQL